VILNVELTNGTDLPAPASTNISVFRAKTTPGAVPGARFDVRLLERHACTTQAFIPMGTGGTLSGEEGIDGVHGSSRT